MRLAKLCIRVFGSNLAGRHCSGAALHAREVFSAEHGVGQGLTGRSYALPTEDEMMQPLPLEEIETAVARFLAFAASRPDLDFEIVRLGCAGAVRTWSQVKALFGDLPTNCRFLDPA